MKKLVLFFAALLFSIGAYADTMNATQQAAFKAAVLADPAFNNEPHNPDGAFDVAAAFNALASPSFTVWKTNVSIDEVGKNFNGSDLAGLTTVNTSRLQVIGIFLANGVNPSLASNRQFFDDIFSGTGGASTRAALLILWKRFATRAEKLFATGTGSDASPATLTFEGNVTIQDVQAAMGW